MNFTFRTFLKLLIPVACSSAALLSFQQPLNVPNKSEHFPIDTTQINNLIYNGRSFIIAAKFDSALIKFNQANHLIKNTSKSLRDSIWWVYNLKYYDAVAQTYNEQGEYQLTRDTLTKVIAQYEQFSGSANQVLGSCYARLGTAYMRLSKLDSAEFYHQKGLEVREKALGKDHIDLANSYYNLGQIQSGRGNQDTALEIFDKALELYKVDKEANLSLMNAVYNAIGIAYYGKGDYDKVLEIFQEGLKNNIKLYGDIHPDVALSLNNIGVVNYIQGKFEPAVESFQKSLDVKKITLGDQHPDLSDTYKNLGVLYNMLGKYEQALKSSQKSLDIRIHKLGEEHLKVADNYTSHGNILINTGKLEQALNYYEKALQIFKKYLKDSDPKLVYTYTSLADVYSNQKNYDKALLFYNKALKIIETQSGPNHPDNADVINNIGKVYDQQENFDSALRYYKRTLEINKNAFGETHHKTALSYNSIGVIYQKQKKYDKAFENLSLAQNIQEAVFDKKSHWLANTKLNIGNLYQTQNEFDLALEYYQQALSALVIDFDDPDIYSSPKINSKIISNSIMLDLLYNKGWTFFQRYEKNTQSEKDLRTAASIFQMGTDLIEHMREDFNWSESKRILYEEAFPTFEKGIQVNRELYQLTQNDTFLINTFTLMEKSKSILLLESIQNSKAQAYHGLPTALLQKEYDIKTSLVYYEKSIFEEELEKEATDKKLLPFYKENLLNLKQSYDSLLLVYKTKYPDYYNLKHSLNVNTVEDVQNDLIESDKALIEYFVGDSIIYAFLITPDNYKIFEMPKDFSLIEMVTNFRKSIFNYHLSDHHSDELYQSIADTLATVSHELFKKLLLPLKTDETLPEKLIIISDGVLGYLPFELLLQDLSENATNFSAHNFLLKDHQISYCYSATLLKEMKNKKRSTKTNGQLLSFAPSFLQSQAHTINPIAYISRSELGPLEHNIPEVESINDLFQGKKYISSAATKEAFINEAENYNIIHLATHGKANDEAEDFSFLAFAENHDSIENDFLYTSELYNMKLHADMVVLSACETGLGKLQKGEGIISLARGFSYAGAKSIITTMWSINDGATTELMTSFYRNLKKHKTKDEALRQAKLDYLQSHPNEEAHPFYWGAFIAVGDMEAITDAGSQQWFWILLFAFLVFLFMVYKRR